MQLESVCLQSFIGVFLSRTFGLILALLLMQAAVETTAELIREACQGFVQFLQELQQSNPEAPSFKKLVQKQIMGMQDIEWLKPPMLSKAR